MRDSLPMTENFLNGVGQSIALFQRRVLLSWDSIIFSKAKNSENIVAIQQNWYRIERDDTENKVSKSIPIFSQKKYRDTISRVKISYRNARSRDISIALNGLLKPAYGKDNMVLKGNMKKFQVYLELFNYFAEIL